MFHHCVTSIVSYFTPWAVSCYRGGGREGSCEIGSHCTPYGLLLYLGTFYKIHCDSGVKKVERGLLAIDMLLVASLRYSWCCRQYGNC